MELQILNNLKANFVENFKLINYRRNELLEKKLDKSAYKEQRKNIIDDLDKLEKQIMNNNWGGYIHFCQMLRPLIYIVHQNILKKTLNEQIMNHIKILSTIRIERIFQNVKQN